MSTTFGLTDEQLEDMTARYDLSQVIAEIDVICFRLDFYELDQWWDYKRSRRRFTHPAVTQWMETYGFAKFDDLPSRAIFAVCESLRRYLATFEQDLKIIFPDEPKQLAQLPQSPDKTATPTQTTIFQ